MRARKSPPPAALKWVVIVIGSIAALVLVLFLFLALFNWNHLRKPIASFVSQRIDRPIRIDGPLQAHLLSWTPRIEAGRVKLGQPSWLDPERGGDAMADIGGIVIEFKLMPLFIGNLILTRLEVQEPVLSLMRERSGRANWEFGARPDRKRRSAPTDLPVIRHFLVQDGRIEISDRLRKLEFTGSFSAGERLGAPGVYPFQVQGEGSLNRKPFALVLHGGPLLNVRRDKPYPFDFEVRAGDTALAARGSIAKPFNLGHLQATLMARGDDLADLYYLTGLALPNTPPYRLSGKLRRENTELKVADLTGKVGDSDIAGDLTIETAGERPLLKAKLASRSLDLDDLAAPLGAAPSIKSGESVSSKQKQLARSMEARARLFPDAKLDLDRIRRMDADVEYRAQAVAARKMPMRRVAFHLRLQDGLMTVEPLSFDLPQGSFAGTVRLDARQDMPKVAADMRITDVQLGQFRPKSSPQPPVEGQMRGRVQLLGQGRSVLEVVSTADGAVTAVVPRGEIREAFAELTGINVARGLGLLLTKDQQQIGVRCGVADFGLQEGALKVRHLVLDTENVLITGEGEIDLDTETADLKIRGRPKKLRLLRVRAPIAIQGPLRKPRIGLEGEKAAGQTGVAAALGALIAPLAAVIAFVDPGLAKDADCAELLAEAQKKGIGEPD